MINIRPDFPIFDQTKDQLIYTKDQLIYFDNAATTQKPRQVIESISNFYSKHNANIHRGIYHFAEYATILFADVRRKVAKFINADPEEIIFTTGTTGSINFVNLAWAQEHIKEGDEIIVSQMEHHSNFIPWQQLAISKKADLKIIPVTKSGQLDLDVFQNLLNEKTKLVSVVHVSNVLGAQNDTEFITKLAHKFNAKVLIDAAQSIAHQKIDVKKIGCDFLAFSGHKLLGPTGIGILYINKNMHPQIKPYQFGGGMVFEVDFEKSNWAKEPYKFEAGTPPIAQAIGLGAAIDYINDNIDFHELQHYEAKFIRTIVEELSKLKNLCFLGPVDQLSKSGHIISFIVKDMHPHDIAAYLDSFGICVRAGHHCAQPLHKALKIDSSVRLSFYGYNTMQEVEYFIDLMKKLLSR